MIQTGLAMAPARCAIEVSVVITRSREAIKAAVSARSRSALDPSKMRISPGRSAICCEGSPFWSEIQLHWAARSKGSKVVEHYRSLRVGLVVRISGPGETDARRDRVVVENRQLAAFFFNLAGFRAQIRAGPRDGFDRGTEDRGQAHQGAFDVECGSRFSQDGDLRSARAHYGQRLQQARDRLLHLQDGEASASGNLGRVAAELDGVAQSLLGMKKKPPAVEQLAAPARLTEIARGAVDFPELPACFIGFPAGGPIAKAKLGEREVVASSGTDRIAVNGGLVGAQRVVGAAQVEKAVAAVGSGLAASGGFSAREDANRLGKSLLGVEENAMHVQGFGMIRIADEGPAQPLPCACRVAIRGPELAPGGEDLDAVGTQCEGSAEVGFGFANPRTVTRQQGQVDPAGDKIGSQLDGAAQCRLGVEVAALFAEQAAEIEPGGGKVGPGGQRATIPEFGFLRSPQTRQGKGGGKFEFRNPGP